MYNFSTYLIAGDNHLSSDNLDYSLYLEIWKGNVAGALKMAAKNEKLSDWLLSLAVAGTILVYIFIIVFCFFSMINLCHFFFAICFVVSPTFWSEMSLLYVQQLIKGGYPHKAILYLLAQNKVHEAIDVLKKHVSYKYNIRLVFLKYAFF